METHRCEAVRFFSINILYSLFNDQVSISAQKKESGELSILLQIGLSVNILQQMEIYAFHLNHPNLSQLQVAIEMRTSKITVWRAYLSMSQQII